MATKWAFLRCSTGDWYEVSLVKEKPERYRAASRRKINS